MGRKQIFPEAEQFTRKRRFEVAIRTCRPSLRLALGGAVIASGILAWIRLSPVGFLIVFAGLSFAWVLALGWVVVAFLRTPTPLDTAKRADRVLGLSDDLMALSEFPSEQESQPWRRAAWERARAAVEPTRQSWTPRLPNRDKILLMASLAATLLAALLGLRGDPTEGAPSLCQNPGDKPGGLQAGSGTDGNPAGDPTELAGAGEAIEARTTVGEGESLVTESRTATGSVGPASAGTEAGSPDYFELSRKAVSDESLPLAHRRTIRTYLERIRPIADTP